MPIGGVIHTEWLNENQNRRYPFWDSASMVDTTGSMTVPNELIADLTFPISDSVSPADFHLNRLTVFGGGITIEIGYQGTTIATRTITEAEHVENKSYLIEGSGDFADSVGRITIGRISDIKRYGGVYAFTATTAPLLPTVCHFSVRGVNALRVATADNEVSDLLQGDIELVAGSNISLAIADLGGGVKQLTVSAITNSDFQEVCECPDDTQGEPIRTINGMSPDVDGNFVIEGLSCVNVQTSAGEIIIDDTCAEPCCGSAELEVLRSEINRLGAEMVTQRNFAQRAFANIEQTRTAVLASKFGSVIPC